MAWPTSVNWLFSFFYSSFFIQLFCCSSISGKSHCHPFVLPSLTHLLYPSVCALSVLSVIPSFMFLPSVLISSFCTFFLLHFLPSALSLYLGFSPKLYSKLPVQQAPNTHLWLIPATQACFMFFHSAMNCCATTLAASTSVTMVASFVVISSMACSVKS
jgi:hypothetical protein